MSAPNLDAGFKTKLREVCPELECRWSFLQCRWVIWYNNPYNGRSYRIHEVKNPDGTFKNPDQREIDMLRVADMSTKIEDIGYQMSKHFARLKEEKQKRIAKQKEEVRKRAKDRMGKWREVIKNAEKGIFYNWQLGNKTIYSLPSFALSSEQRTTKQLLNKFGKPYLTGGVTEISSSKQADSLIINP